MEQKTFEREVHHRVRILETRATEDWGRELSHSEIFYVYVLLDSRKPGVFVYEVSGKRVKFDHEPFYVGKGKGNRKSNHVAETLRDKTKNAYKANKIRRILASGNEVIAKQVSALSTEATAFAKEAMLIEAIGRGKKGPLTNMSEGGEGATGVVRSVVTRQRMREAALKRTTTHVHTEDTRLRMRASHLKLAPIECPHCPTRGNKGLMHRFHFANCPNAPANRGKTAPNRKMQKVECPECGFLGSGNAMHRWHFENCKNK